MEAKPDYEADALVLYDDETDPLEIAKTAESLRKKGYRVRVQREEEHCPSCRETIRLNKEANA